MDPPDFVGMGPPDFAVMDPPDFVPMGPPAGAAFRPCSARVFARRPGSRSGTATAAQIGRFSVMASARAHTAIQYRRGTSRTGELDSAKEADGG
jgi:hypothetical protein